MTKTTSEAKLGAEDSKDCIVDSVDSCKLGTKAINKELSLLDCILDSTDPMNCHKDCYKDLDISDPTVESTGCTNCAKLTDVQERCMSNCEG